MAKRQIDTNGARVPHPIDSRLGINLRLRRKTLNISLETLAAGVGVTFQQIQKYERGANRISASKLYEIAQVLETPVEWFFQSRPDMPEAPEPELASVHEFLNTDEGAALVSLFPRIRGASLRLNLLRLIRMLAGGPHPTDEASTGD